MNNGTNPEVIEQFNNISRLKDTWDHNQQYQQTLLKYVGVCNNALDIGCGTGEYTREIAKYSKRVIGIDVSPEMINKAKLMTNDENVDFFCTDLDTFLKEDGLKYDFISSIAVLHHLDEKSALEKMKSCLNKDGVITILDLYKSESFFDYLSSFFAMILNPFMMLIKRHRLWITEQEREAWKDHFQYDNYKTINEIKEIAKEVLGECTIKRHLFWRYSLVYRK